MILSSANDGFRQLISETGYTGDHQIEMIETVDRPALNTVILKQRLQSDGTERYEELSDGNFLG